MSSPSQPALEELAPRVARPHPQVQRDFSRARLAGILPIASLLVPLSILTLVGWLNWLDVWRDAESEIRRAAQSAAEYGQRSLESYSFAAGRVNDRLRGLSDDEIRGDAEGLHHELRRIGSELSQAELSYVIDRNGYPLLASNLFPVPDNASLADRDYFQALRGRAAPPVHVSQTFVGRFDGGLFFSVARPRRNTGNPPTADGFDGVVLVSVSPNVLAGGLRRLLPQPSDHMALMRLDGYGISTTSGLPDPGSPLPKVEAISPFYEFAGQGVKSAAYISRTAIPGSRSLLAMNLLDGFPIYAVAIRPSAQIAAQWRKIMLPHVAFGLPVTLGLFLLGIRVWRDQRRLAGMNVELQRDNELSTDRLDRASRFGLVGTFEHDLLTGKSLRSAEYMAVQGLRPVATEETDDDWSNRLHPDDRQRVEAEVLRALSPDSGDTDYAQTYRIVTPAGQVRWIAARAEITRDATGRAVLMRGAHVDVTPLRNTELALAESDARLRLAQESLGIGAWEWVPPSPVVNCSRKFAELLGLALDGNAAPVADILSRIHSEDRRSVRQLLRDIRRTGGFRAECRVVRNDAAEKPETIWIAVRARLMKSSQIGPERLMGIAFDITDSKRAEQLQTLMSHEVEHRAKNALAVVSSLLHMTKAERPEDFVRSLDGRVSALSKTMGLLGKGRWQGASLRDMVESELEPFRLAEHSGGARIVMAGPPVTVGVDAAQPISMALHELATNAAKYGALSVVAGRVSVTWWTDDQRVHIRWEERGGPVLDGEPPMSGFGSRLLTILLEGQIGGSVNRRWEAEGLVCEMSFPSSGRQSPGKAG